MALSESEAEPTWPVEVYLGDVFTVAATADPGGTFEGLPTHIRMRRTVTVDGIAESVTVANWVKSEIIQIIRPLPDAPEEVVGKFWTLEDGAAVLFRASKHDMTGGLYNLTFGERGRVQSSTMNFIVSAGLLNVGGANIHDGNGFSDDIPFDVDKPTKYNHFAAHILGVIEPETSLARLTLVEPNFELPFSDEPPTTE